MDQITHDVRREHWLNVINACQARNENITIRQWLKDNGIGYKSYYYWLRKFRREAFERMKPDTSIGETGLAEIRISDDPDVGSVLENGFKADAIIKMDGCVVALSNTISETLCKIILEDLKDAR